MGLPCGLRWRLHRRLLSSALGLRERSARLVHPPPDGPCTWANGRVRRRSAPRTALSSRRRSDPVIYLRVVTPRPVCPTLQARRAVGTSPSDAGASSPGSSALGPQANTAAASVNTHAPVEVLVGDAEQLELPRASLDLIMCSASLPYMYDPEGAVRRWREWLGPGGRLLVNMFRVGGDPGD